MAGKEVEHAEQMKITIRVGDAYHNNRREADEVIISADVDVKHPTFGAAVYWYKNEKLYIGYTGTTDTGDYDWGKKLRTFTLEELVEGSLRFHGYNNPDATEEKRAKAREQLINAIKEAGLEKEV